MNNLKAIETVYKGYRFRSRLEARWAVFFDTLGVQYEYEKEGFEIEGVGRYLPDFYLPQLDCWFEVKGQEPLDLEIKKAVALGNETDKPVIISIQSFDGLRVPNCYFFSGDTDQNGGGIYENTGHFELKNDKPVFIVSDYKIANGDRTIYTSIALQTPIDWVLAKGVKDTCEMYESSNQTSDMSVYKDIGKLEDAVIAACQARFEFNR